MTQNHRREDPRLSKEKTVVAPQDAALAKRSFVQLIKFALVGVMNTLVDFLVFTVLQLIFDVPDEAVLLIGLFTLISYVCGLLNSFMLNTRWTFKKEYKRSAREKWLFIAVNLVSWLVSFALTYVFTNYVFAGSGIAETVTQLISFLNADVNVVSILAKLVSAPFVIIVNFIGSKLFVFTNKTED